MSEETQGSSAPVNDGATQPQGETMVPQSHVNVLLSRTRAEAEARTKAQFEQQQQMQQQAKGMMSPDSHDAIVEQITKRAEEKLLAQQERMQKEQEQREMNAKFAHAATNYRTMKATGKEHYEDFEEVVSGFDEEAFPNLVFLLSHVPDGQHILYQIAQNPKDLMTLDGLSKTSPRMAMAELKKMAAAHAANSQAIADATNNKVPAPLENLQGTRMKQQKSSDKLSIAERRRQPHLRR